MSRSETITIWTIRAWEITRNMHIFYSFKFFSTLFLNCNSKSLLHSMADVAAREATAISTPLDNVPLYTVPIGEEVPITLLKSSQAAWISDLLRFGTPEMRISYHVRRETLKRTIYLTYKGGLTGTWAWQLIISMNLSLQRSIFSILKEAIPVTKAFWSCPLNPVAQGLTVATLLHP